MSLGVADLVDAMHALRERFEATSVRVGVPVERGAHTMFVEVTDDGMLVLEREDGHAVIVSDIGAG